MQNKQSKKFIILAVLLVAVALPALWLSGVFGPKKAVEPLPGEKKLADFAAEDVTEFRIQAPGSEAFSLVKDAEKWYLVQGPARYPASMEKVQPLLDDVPGLMSEAEVTSKPDKHPDFEVEEGKAIVLSVLTGGTEPALTLQVGKAATGYQNAFVRVDGGDSVYRAAKNVKSLVGFAFVDYRSKQPWAFDPLLVSEITIAPPPAAAAKEGETAPPAASGPALTFKKSGEFWQHDGKNANQNQITTLLEGLKEVSANEFVDAPDDTKTGLAGLAPQLSVVSPAGKVSFTIGSEENSLRFVADQEGFVYKVSPYNLRSYLEELKYDQLLFDDTPAVSESSDSAGEATDVGAADSGAAHEGSEPDEGAESDKPSDKDEGK